MPKKEKHSKEELKTIRILQGYALAVRRDLSPDELRKIYKKICAVRTGHVSHDTYWKKQTLRFNVMDRIRDGEPEKSKPAIKVNTSRIPMDEFAAKYGFPFEDKTHYISDGGMESWTVRKKDGTVSYMGQMSWNDCQHVFLTLSKMVLSGDVFV
jgi:hypothetical protein